MVVSIENRRVGFRVWSREIINRHDTRRRDAVVVYSLGMGDGWDLPVLLSEP